MKTLIAYYSRTGNTRKIAKLIAEKTDGNLFEITPKQAYPESYSETVEQAKKEIKAGYLPELISLPGSMEGYDTVFIGTPNWWSTFAPPVASFISGCDLNGKTIVPFCTHGSGGEAGIFKDIIKLCPGCKALKGFAAYGDGGPAAVKEINEWLESIGMTDDE